MRIPTLVALCGAVALSWACNPENEPGTEEKQPGLEDRTRDETEREATERREVNGRGGAGMGMPCPMDVPGTTVELSESDGSVVMTFVTTRGDVEELRDHVRKLAERWERRAMRRDDRGDEVGEGRMPRTSTAVEQVEGGARLVLVPEDPQDLDELRARARARQENMSSSGKCMMKDDES